MCVCVSNANKYTSAGVILYESTKPSFVTHDFILNTPSIDLLLNIYVAIVFLSFSPIPRNGRFIGSVGLSVYAVLRLIMRVCVVCRTYFYCKICAFPHAYYMSTHKRYCSIYANIAASKCTYMQLVVSKSFYSILSVEIRCFSALRMLMTDLIVSHD